MSDQLAFCGLCGHPMPEGESMFKFHGYSGPCPQPSEAAKHALETFSRVYNAPPQLSNKTVPDVEAFIESQRFCKDKAHNTYFRNAGVRCTCANLFKADDIRILADQFKKVIDEQAARIEALEAERARLKSKVHPALGNTGCLICGQNHYGLQCPALSGVTTHD